MITARKCEICGVEFIPNNKYSSHQKYCSKKCSKRAEYLRDKDKIMLRNRKNKVKRRGGISNEEGYEIKRCRFCDQQFVDYGGAKIYCSEKCKNKYHYQTNPKPRGEYAVEGDIRGTCLFCGQPFRTDNPRRGYCSFLCYQRHYREKNRIHIRKKHRVYSKLDNIKHKEKKRIRKYNYDNHRDLIFENCDNRCAICGSTERLVVHHNIYSGDWRDCVVLCIPCHYKVEKGEYAVC